MRTRWFLSEQERLPVEASNLPDDFRDYHGPTSLVHVLLNDLMRNVKIT